VGVASFVIIKIKFNIMEEDLNLDENDLKDLVIEGESI